MVGDRKNINRLLELYFSGKLKGDSGDIVRGWLISGDDAGEKEVALARFFNKLVTVRRLLPDSYTLLSLAAIQEELGFTDRQIRTLENHKIFRRRRTLRRMAAGFAAAAVLITGAIVLPDMFNPAGPAVHEEVRIVAELSSDKEVVLPDGSTVTLKGGAGIAYDEAGFAENRAVEFDGEGFFTVSYDPEHPFVVSTGDVTVTVLGTEFSVRAWDSEDTSEVALESGSVQVASGDSAVTLSPMEKATINRADGTITLEDISKGEVLKFKGENLSFREVSLEEALTSTGDYFGVRIRIADDLSDAANIVLHLEKEATLDDALFVLQSVAPDFNYSIEGDTVTVTKK